MKPPLRNSRMRNEGPRSLLSPSQRYTDAGTSGRRAQRMERHADKWSKRGILSRDISLSGIVEPPPSLLWTPKSSLCYVLIKTWNVSLQICKVICIRMTWWLRQPHKSYLILTLCYPETELKGLPSLQRHFQSVPNSLGLWVLNWNVWLFKGSLMCT